jgi:hypothetical protein
MQHLSAPGWPDYGWAFRGKMGLLEVKKPDHRGKKPAMQCAQVLFHARWEAQGVIIPVVQDPSEAYRAILWEVRDGQGVRGRSFREFRWLDANEHLVLDHCREQFLADLLVTGR